MKQEKQRLLITGAQGFLGRYLVAELASTKNIDILGIGRSEQEDENFSHNISWGDITLKAPLTDTVKMAIKQSSYRYQICDLCDLQDTQRLIKDFQPHAVIHLAAALRDAPLQNLIYSNILSSANLLEAITALQKNSLPRIIFGSTGGVYGQPATVPISEQANCQPIDQYSLSKYSAEQMGRILAKQHRLPMLWARIFNIIGPGQQECHLCGHLARQLVEISYDLRPAMLELGPLTSSRDFIDVRDAAIALKILLFEGQQCQIYNVASGIETVVQKLVDEMIVHASLTKPLQRNQLPSRPAEINRHFASIEELNMLGFRQQVSLSASLQDSLAYYQHEVIKSATLLNNG